MNRDDLLFQTLRRMDLKHSSWLDVGAGSGKVSIKMRNLLKPCYFRCIDIKPPKVMRGEKFIIERFYGCSFPDMGDKTVSFVLFNFVLHHAAEHTESLLLEAGRVASRGIIVQEDLVDGTPENAATLLKHDPKGIFRTDEVWKQLLLRVAVIRHPTWSLQTIYFSDKLDDVDFHTPRALYILGESSMLPHLPISQQIQKKHSPW